MIITKLNISSQHRVWKRKNKDIRDSKPLDWGTCIVQLPNGELFCFGKNYLTSGITLIIDTKYKAQLQPSGKPCGLSSVIYFNRSVYCFGGWDENRKSSSLSERFDLDESRWIKLTSMPQADCYCHSIIFDRSILIWIPKE